MTEFNITKIIKTNIKVSLILGTSFIVSSSILSFKAGAIYKDFVNRMDKYDRYEITIQRHQAEDSAIHANIFRRLAHEGL